MKAKWQLITSIIILICTCAFSQTNFSGSWLPKNEQTLSGPTYTNALPEKVNINQTDDSVIIESIEIGSDGNDLLNRISVSLNGIPFVSVGVKSKRKFLRSATWSADKTILKITTIIYTSENENNVDFTRVESWNLDAGGKQLTIDRKSIETRSESWEVKGVFARQLVF